MFELGLELGSLDWALGPPTQYLVSVCPFIVGGVGVVASRGVLPMLGEGDTGICEES